METPCSRQAEHKKNIRAADAKEVGVGNPAEETYCYPNNEILGPRQFLSTPRARMLTSLMHSENRWFVYARSVLPLQTHCHPHTICLFRASEFCRGING